MPVVILIVTLVISYLPKRHRACFHSYDPQLSWCQSDASDARKHVRAAVGGFSLARLGQHARTVITG